MNIKKLSFLLSLVLVFAVYITFTNAEGDGKNKQNSVNKPLGTPVRAFLDINQILTVLKNDGISDIDVNEANSGLVYPKGSGKTAVYTSGFLWGAYEPGDPQVRVGGTAYRTGLQPGKITNSGLPWDQLTAEDPNAENVRIFRVRPDVYPGGPSVDLSPDATLEANSESAIRTQYETDWSNWPAADGAPYYDGNGNGIYDPIPDPVDSLRDIPGIPGADQTVWFVANDLDPSRTQFMYGANPLGIEMQATFWAYAQSGPLGSMYFRKYRIINKTNNSFDSMYVSMWSDVDDGNATDDFAGCDTTLSLGFCYNASATDATYNPLPPPAVGFDFFQGPISGGDTLGMTAYYYFARGDQSVTDPTQGDIQGSNQFYNFFRGRIGLTGQIFTDPNGRPTTFALDGDPQTGTGWLDGQQISSGDRRIGSASGPFTMAPGDTQDVVVAEIVAGAIPGVDRISAIGLLKYYDQFAQFAYDVNFDLPVPPPAPEVNVVTLDKKIILDWGENQTKVDATENYFSKGHTFEGYNIYQLPSASATVTEGIRVATFDAIDGVLKINDDVFDPQTGSVVNIPVQFGNDTGIRRYFEVTTDAIRGGTPLINGIRYYFAVTAYSYNGAAPVGKTLETPLRILTIVPQSINPGVSYQYTAGDTIVVDHSGPSDGSVVPLVVDPSKLTGHNYKVTFDTLNGETVWTLTDLTSGSAVFENQTAQDGDEAKYQISNGLLVKVLGPPPGVKDWDIPEGTRRFTWADADGFGWEGFNGAIGWGSPAGPNGFGSIPTEPVSAAELFPVLLKLASVPDTTSFENPSIDPNDPNVSFGYRYLRGATDPPARPEFAPYIIDPSSGYRFQDFTKSVPLSAWDVQDPANPRRLAVGYLENNAEFALLDGRYFPGSNGAYNNTAGDGPREWLFIYDADYSETADPNYSGDILNDPIPVMYWLTVNRRGEVPFSPDETGEDQFLIIPNYINTSADEFTFTSPAPGYSNDLAKNQVNEINVFPNPYYGVNSEELNKYNRFVTFSHLPAKATIRIFNLAGVLVRTIEKSDPGQFQRWDLANEFGLPVASGLYIAYIDMPDVGTTKILKLAVIQEQQVLDRF